MNNYEEEITHPVAVDLLTETSTVLSYWNSLSDGRRAPAWKEFDFLTLPLNLIPWCAVVDVDHDPRDYQYRFFGSARVRVQRTDYTGRRVSDVTPAYLSKKVAGDYDLIVEAFAPKFFRTIRRSAVNPARKLQYHFLRVPFSNDDTRVDHILSFGYFEEGQIKEMHEFFDHEL